MPVAISSIKILSDPGDCCPFRAPSLPSSFTGPYKLSWSPATCRRPSPSSSQAARMEDGVPCQAPRNKLQSSEVPGSSHHPLCTSAATYASRKAWHHPLSCTRASEGPADSLQVGFGHGPPSFGKVATGKVPVHSSSSLYNRETTLQA